jgi:hypothetical protein
VRQRTHRHEVGTGRGKLRQTRQRDAAGNFGPGPATAAVHGLENLGRGQVVEQHDVGTGAQRVVHLRQALGFDFDPQVGLRCPRARHGGCDAAGQTDVVVLDQHAVVEPHPVIGGAAGAHGVFLELAEERGGLARIEDDDAAGCGVHELTRQRGDALSRWMKFRAVRSPVSSAAAGPRTLATTVPGTHASPSTPGA